MTQEELKILDSLDEDIEDIFDDVEVEEAGYLETYKTYLQFLEDIDKELGVSYVVHEYSRPNGSKGFVAYFKYSIGEKEFIKSIGYGEEDRDFAWQEIINEEL